MRKDELAELYESKVLLTEAEKVKGFSRNPGQSFEGEEKAKKIMPGTGLQSKGVDIKKPVENAELSPGHGNIKEEKEHMVLPRSAFDELYKSTLVEEELGVDDESPLEKSGPGAFDDDEGDFAEMGEEEPTEDEEVDVATELRMIIDRLTELAEKLGAFDDEELGGEEDALEDEEMMEDEPVPESHVMDGMKPLPDSKGKMTSKGNFKVKSKVSQPAGKAQVPGGPGKGTPDGKLSSLSKSKFLGSKDQKADAKGPAATKGASLFGS